MKKKTHIVSRLIFLTVIVILLAMSINSKAITKPATKTTPPTSTQIAAYAEAVSENAYGLLTVKEKLSIAMTPPVNNDDYVTVSNDEVEVDNNEDLDNTTDSTTDADNNESYNTAADGTPVDPITGECLYLTADFLDNIASIEMQSVINNVQIRRALVPNNPTLIAAQTKLISLSQQYIQTVGDLYVTFQDGSQEDIDTLLAKIDKLDVSLNNWMKTYGMR